MRKMSLLLIFALILTMAGCGGKEITPDYADAASFEAALNAGLDRVLHHQL